MTAAYWYGDPVRNSAPQVKQVRMLRGPEALESTLATLRKRVAKHSELAAGRLGEYPTKKKADGGAVLQPVPLPGHKGVTPVFAGYARAPGIGSKPN